MDKVLKILSERYGKHFTDYVYSADSGEIKGFLQFLINGKNASSLNGLQTKIKDGDVLALLPPVGGG